jgi:hypothetical protein
VLDLSTPERTYEPTDVVVRTELGADAVVDVLGPAGRHDGLNLVRQGGHWRVELDL